MKKITKLCLLLIVLLAALTGCKKFLEREIPTSYTEEEAYSSYERISQAGYGVYGFLYNRFGYHRINWAMLASASDEADHADPSSTIHRFNTGNWNATSNPDDLWAHFYQGILRANLFLEHSADYKKAVYRDTIDVNNRNTYQYNIRDIAWLRAEARFLRALYHFELLKRYGGVPIMAKSVVDLGELRSIRRNTFDECVQFVASECDLVYPELKDTWVGFDSEKWRGRVNKGAALALKSRVLLYAASPLHNTANDLEKWRQAAKAAHDVIALGRYGLHNNYLQLFRLGNGADGNLEVIFSIQGQSDNSFERYNYPVGYELGGQGSTSPSQNLVDAYEMKPTGMAIHELGSGYNPASPYTGRDPRLDLSILRNGFSFKGRAIETFVGGKDGLGLPKATTTGYYLRKYVDENLNLVQNNVSVHGWILFRYAEVLLNFAEAMNEANGPEVSAGYSLNAKKAVDMVRARSGIAMPPLPPGLSQTEMRQRIRNERRVELAFEEHRFFDVRRWKIAQQTENAPVMAMRIIKNPDNTLKYTVVKAEDRVFANRMYFFPVPETEILKSGGSLVQSPEW